MPDNASIMINGFMAVKSPEILIEIMRGFDLDEILSSTDVKLIVPDHLLVEN